MTAFTDRQQRELEYHRQYAHRFQTERSFDIDFNISTEPTRRWWNAYWHAYTRLIEGPLNGRAALVVGCGFGEDAIRLARLGARVWACDLSPESLDIARRRARRYGTTAITFDEMPAEHLTYPDDAFDLIVAIDILHHVNIPGTLKEWFRVARQGCRVVCNEPYTHSLLTMVRDSWLVDRYLAPRVWRWRNGITDPAQTYTTPDERKLDQHEMRLLRTSLRHGRAEHFNWVTERLVGSWVPAAKVDRACLHALGPLGSLLAGRVVITGEIRKGGAHGC